MVWLVGKKVIHHQLDLGCERVNIPVRVKFEFEILKGSFVTDSLSTDSLYNRQLLQKRYPQLDLISLDQSIEQLVKREIYNYINQLGLMRVDDG